MQWVRRSPGHDPKGAMLAMSSNSCNSRNLLRYACGGWNNPCSPYYNGPCPDADGGFAGTSCGCRPRPGNGGAERSAQGRFMSPMPLNTIAGACVPLMPCGDPCGLETAGGAVEIKDAGVYYAAYTLSLPAGTALTTTLTPTLNGAALPAGAVEV